MDTKHPGMASPRAASNAQKLHPQTAHRSPSGQRAVLVALAGDVVVASIKFIAGFLSGSSAMISEGVHTLIDASTEVILLYGLVMSRRRGTPAHQLGYGREVFFWNFVVAILIFSLGSGIAFLAGVRQIIHPATIEGHILNFTVIVCSGAVEIIGLREAFRKSRRGRSKESLYQSLVRQRDPTSMTILFGGIAALVGLIVTACGLLASMVTANAVYDGVASVVIAGILAVTAFKLATESKSLLIGVPADPEIVKGMIATVAAAKPVETVNGVVSVHLSPDQLLVAISVAFKAGLNTETLEAAVAQIEASLRAGFPQIVALFIKPQSQSHYAELHGKGAPLTCFAQVQSVGTTPYTSL
ncbi:cation diffusion facilitator family transporter [Rhizobium calliandrae]|uniref:Cation diffusion facilitator family transporter n=1 Tax=Rhizobium calliandrae TaxID=1312182 RepID=A0ABT7KJR7_9HYPH|nr:cation diffusion facilitator family transporter [Rhizobium calliandrae]MDL2408213.1 cation diffusion facilitator family transporter [Rhizobium calliandrae]